MRETGRVREVAAITDDVRKRGNLARSAHHKKTGGGGVWLLSDRLTPTQWERRNGDLRVYALGRPMTPEQYNAMPADLQKLYLRLLRDRHGATVQDVTAMLGACDLLGVRFSGTEGDQSAWTLFLSGAWYRQAAARWRALRE